MAKKLKVQEAYIPKVYDTIYIYFRSPQRLLPVPYKSSLSLNKINQLKKIIECHKSIKFAPCKQT